MKKTLSLLLIVGFSCSLIAQQNFREFDLNDSTAYTLNPDTAIVVSKTKVYYQTSGGTRLIRDFSTPDGNMYIRDFDIVSDNVWYAIFGGRNWGGASLLYKTLDKGLTWTVDSSIFAATKPVYEDRIIADESLYQLHRISEDTLLLFVSYYQCGIFYSIDAGQSWDLWFANTPANYKGIFRCGTDYYLWGQEGDGFPGSMFGFDASLLLSPDTNNAWTHFSENYHPSCYNSGNPDCIYVPNSKTGYEQFLFFQNYISQNCSNVTSTLSADIPSAQVMVYPNPSQNGIFSLQWDRTGATPIQYSILSANGQLIVSDKISGNSEAQFNLSGFNRGLYFLVVKYGDGVVRRKIIF
ncbi:MAG: T9SS type A sorting domain-containing protein [Bacteroidota bacterium]